MYGIGALVHVVNILPFSYFLFTPFAFRRYNLLGVNPIGNRRFYYKKWWVRMFFGRFQYTFYSVFIPFMIIKNYRSNDNRNDYIANFTAFYNDYEQFDEEESSHHRNGLSKYLYRKKVSDNRNIVNDSRAQIDHDLKIKAFEKYERMTQNSTS